MPTQGPPLAILAGIASGIRTIEGNASLFQPTNFNSRADAIDFLEFHIIDRMEGLMHDGGQLQELDHLHQHAEKLKHRLEKIDTAVFQQLRENIRTGIYTGPSFGKIIETYLGSPVGTIDHGDDSGYDNLDIFINGLLSHQPMPASTHPMPDATKEPTPEMVFYQKTPARIIFRMTEMAHLQQDDVFFDIGSGLGQAAILVNLISGARTRGIEYEPAYFHYAQTATSKLNLSNVEFINSDALDGDYAEGTVFFLYTPFHGRLLQAMLEILYKESRNRMIRIFTYGPCSPHVARQHWLHCVNGDAQNPFKLFEFRPGP